MKKIITLLVLFSMMGHVTIAQSIKTYLGETTVKLEGGKIDCKEKYNYYVDDNGNYVKSGNYSLNGTSNSFTYQGNVSATYSILATYKNGILDGHLTAKLIIKGRGEWLSWARSYKTYDIERILSANFKDGVPDGQWTYTEKGLMDDDNSIYKTTFTCENGKFVGDFNCNFSGLNVPKHQQGSFDQNGNLLSLTIQGGGAGQGAGIGVGDVGTKEYHLNSNRDLLSYFHRDYNNQAIDHYRFDDNLMKEYETQSLSPKTFLEDKGYYLTKKTDKMNIRYSSYTFGTATIVQYILQQLYLKPTEFFGSPSYLEGFGRFSGLFDSYNANKYEFEKKTVKAFAESDLLAIKNHLEYNADYFNEMADTAVVSEVINYAIKEKDIYLMSIGNKLRYFEEDKCSQIKSSIAKLWEDVKDSLRREEIRKLNEKKNAVLDLARIEIEKYMKEVKSWPTDSYKEEYRTIGYGSMSYNEPIGKKLVLYYNSGRGNANIWKIINPYYDQGRLVSEAMKKFEKFHKVVSYTIDTVYLSTNWDTATICIKIDKSASFGYETYKSDAFCTNNKPYGDGRYESKLIWGKSFETAERVSNICDTSKSLGDSLLLILFQKKTENIKSREAIKKIILGDKTYSTYSSEIERPKSGEVNPDTWNMYYKRMIPIQKDYITFLQLRQSVEKQGEIIISSNDKNVSDIAKSYQLLSNTWPMDVEEKGKIKEEIKRMEGYLTLQDSCLTFIELRKTITQNNTNIANYTKTAPTIVKAYNSYMKGVDLTWTPELGRNQAVREIINTQNALINELSKPNISEVDKTVKKSKAKMWEDVKKIVFQ